jgi:hypothetical protein
MEPPATGAASGLPPADEAREGRAEELRLQEDATRARNWKRWGPYLSERQWGTVREDYSASGFCWGAFPHDHARSRAYRWGEDGLLGICDREGRLCFSVALWNGRDAILKERLFGLSGPEGNHGEDVKEEYYYLDSTPTHSYMKALYRYPLAEYPYGRLVEENRRRGLDEREFELADSGALAERGYVDVVAEYAKASPDDLLIRITLANRSDAPATLSVLPTLWFRNTWSWGRTGEGYGSRPQLQLHDGQLMVEHPTLARLRLAAAPAPSGVAPRWLFTENESNSELLWGAPNPTPYVKDAFHAYVVRGERGRVNPAGRGTKASALYALELPASGQLTLQLRLYAEDEAPAQTFGAAFQQLFEVRRREADAFYAARTPAAASPEEARVLRQGWAGLLWSKQFYHYVVKVWLEGDPAQPPPPPERLAGRNVEWTHLYNRDVISKPDKWEYPWYAAWDLAFHMIPFARIDPQFAKEQLLLLLREWYLHPNGQVPAYEFNFGDVNPPVHAWACWRVYKITGKRGERDRAFLARAFQKLLLNFTWWVNRKDTEGKNLFAGGFLGLDNIGVFDRSRPLPTGGSLEQADGTAWMAFYCSTMLSMALELAGHDPVYEDMASKFFEHFVAIADAMNNLGGSGLWDAADGFYYDQLHVDGHEIPLKVRSAVGLVPLVAVEVLEDELLDRLPGFKKRFEWFLANRPELAAHISCMKPGTSAHRHRLLAIPSRERLERVLAYMLDESEFLSPHGLRSLSRVHAREPYVFRVGGEEHRVDYVPAESDTRLFGGNSNWRGPVWFPLNFLLVEALERYHHFYGDELTVEYPTGSGRRVTLDVVARDLARRLSSIFLPDAQGRRPVHGEDARYARDPGYRDLVLFYEYFDGDTGRGLGASHQTGWSALVVTLLRGLAASRRVGDPSRA